MLINNFSIVNIYEIFTFIEYYLSPSHLLYIKLYFQQKVEVVDIDLGCCSVGRVKPARRFEEPCSNCKSRSSPTTKTTTYNSKNLLEMSYSLNLMSPSAVYSIVFKVLTLAYIVYRSYAHKSLTNTGIAAAFITGVIHSLPPSNLFLVLIVVFYLTSSKATKFKDEIKSKKTKIPADKNSLTTSHTQRTHIQVLANSIVASILILVSIFTKDEKIQNILKAGVVSQYAAVIADTWSSELGILSKTDPFLITNFKTVPPGTNGGVSNAGLLSGLAGASLISAVSVVTYTEQKFVLWIYFSFIGLLGSVIDSLLGAFLQASVIDKKDGLILESLGGSKINETYVNDTKNELQTVSGSDILSNNQVNVAMATITTIISMTIYSIIFSK